VARNGGAPIPQTHAGHITEKARLSTGSLLLRICHADPAHPRNRGAGKQSTPQGWPIRTSGRPFRGWPSFPSMVRAPLGRISRVPVPEQPLLVADAVGSPIVRFPTGGVTI
jgi:hypothetical protein